MKSGGRKKMVWKIQSVQNILFKFAHIFFNHCYYYNIPLLNYRDNGQIELSVINEKQTFFLPSDKKMTTIYFDLRKYLLDN